MVTMLLLPSIVADMIDNDGVRKILVALHIRDRLRAGYLRCTLRLGQRRCRGYEHMMGSNGDHRATTSAAIAQPFLLR